MSELIMQTTQGAVKVTYGLDLMLRISETKGKNLGTITPWDIQWTEFAPKLLTTTRTKETEARYQELHESTDQGNKAICVKIKNVGGYVGSSFVSQTRERAGVTGAQLLSLDFDKDVTLSDVWDTFCLLEYAGLFYTTHSHTRDKNRFRIAIPLSRHVSRAEYEVLAREFVSLLGSPEVDAGSYQAERVMFWPSTPSDGEFISGYSDGDILNPDDLLRGASSVVTSAANRQVPKKPEDPTQKKGVIGAFCRAYSIHEAIAEYIPDAYELCDRGDNYYTYRSGTAAGGLWVPPPGLHAYSHHSTDPANTEHAVNAFDLVRIHLFRELDKRSKPGTEATKLPSYKAMRELALESPAVNEGLRREERDRAASDYDEAEAAYNMLGSEPAQRVLSELLKQISWVDFRDKADLKQDAIIPRKTYVTIAVDQLLETAVSNQWGLCTKNGFIYVYNGSYWQVVDVGDFRQSIAKAAIKMGVPSLEARHHLFRDELYKQFIAEANLPTPESKQSTLINLKNGTFEISDTAQELREPRREDFIKYQLPFEYNPDAVCPMFDAFINQVQPDEACRRVLSEYIGYVFVRSLKLEKLLMLYGSGANGKSVFFGIVRALLGPENVCSYSLADLTRPDSWQRAELGNNLLNYTSELSVKLENSIFKQLVSGEAVGAQRKYQDPFTMTDYARLMVNGNILPRATELTDAFFRRFLIVPFSVTIPEDQQDPELTDKIVANELSGVFNWVLSGLRRLLDNKGFTKSDVIRRQVESYRRESDSVALFMDEEGYAPSVDRSIPLKGIYEEYGQYCFDNGYMKVSNKEMRKRLEVAGYIVERKNAGRVLYAHKPIKE